MKKETPQNNNISAQPAYFFPSPSGHEQEDEIDLFDLLTAIFLQWKWLLGITLAGTCLGILIALLWPRQYEVIAQIAKPVNANIMALNIRGYENITTKDGFIRFYNELKSVERLKQFVYAKEWHKKVFPNLSASGTEDKFFAAFFQDFKTEILETNQTKDEENSTVPELVNIKMSGNDEKLIVELLNAYVKYTNQYVIETIKSEGQSSVKLEVEKIERIINIFRQNEKTKRELLIQKIENDNKEKINTLANEVDLLLTKESMDKDAKIAKINEAIKIAKQIGIKKPTTIEALAIGDSTQTMVSVTSGDRYQYALMGTIYLNSELENLKSRLKDELFVPEISQLKKQIEDIKRDERLKALKARTSDDPYIIELPALLKRLSELEKINFNFKGARLYRWDRQASVDGVAEKPNRKQIVGVSFVLSAFIGLLFVLILNGVRKREKDPQENVKNAEQNNG